MADNEISKPQGQGITRRTLVAGAGGIGLGALLGGLFVKGFIEPDKAFSVPASEGYLLVDTKKCAGCHSCMLACSLVHTGQSSLTLSRIQVTNNVFAPFPGGVTQQQCRQCPHPWCAEACPTGALHADEENGNVRLVDPGKCIGCERCVNACPFTPSRVQWNAEDRTAQKCDLCAVTPYFSETGGPGGKQACVEVCPTRAIAFTDKIPVQTDEGYRVNLRKDEPAWALLGFPQGDDGEYIAAPAAAAGGH